MPGYLVAAAHSGVTRLLRAHDHLRRCLGCGGGVHGGIGRKRGCGMGEEERQLVLTRKVMAGVFISKISNGRKGGIKDDSG